MEPTTFLLCSTKMGKIPYLVERRDLPLSFVFLPLFPRETKQQCVNA